ncbi:MAG: hypothetical protein ACO1N9_01800 [Flavobacterium sp.]
MKYLVLLFLFALPGYAQSTGFTIRENGVVWENVYVTDEADVAAILERHPGLTITSQKGNIYTGTATNIKNSCPGSTPALVDAKMNFNFEIEKSAGMYRVTIKKIRVLPTGKNKKAAYAEQYFIEKGELKSGAQTATDLSCLEAMFNRMFTATNLLKNKL